MRYYFGCYWYNRTISIEESSSMIVEFLSLIKDETDYDFEKWFEKGYSISEALSNPIKLTDEEVLNLIVKSNKLEGKVLHRPFYSDLGFRFSAWNGSSNGNDCSVSILLGGSGYFVPNCCVIDVPIPAHSGKVNSIIPLFVKIISFWNPQWAVFNSSVISEKLQSANKIGLLNYYSSEFKFPDLPNSIFEFQKNKNGSVINLKNGHFFDNLDDKLLENLRLLFEEMTELNPNWGKVQNS